MNFKKPKCAYCGSEGEYFSSCGCGKPITPRPDPSDKGELAEKENPKKENKKGDLK